MRLFALAIGSWLYRMEDGFWLTATHRLGHTGDFRGPFQLAMANFFFVPNLVFAELMLRWRERRPTAVPRLVAPAALNTATLFVVGTYYFVRCYPGAGTTPCSGGAGPLTRQHASKCPLTAGPRRTRLLLSGRRHRRPDRWLCAYRV